MNRLPTHMSISSRISQYINSLAEAKKQDIEILHQSIIQLHPQGKLWFEDGVNSEGKVVSNPNIGYGECMLSYANGSSRAFYRVGISANSSGISVYFFGMPDKNFLKETFATRIGKAAVTGYCIKFKSLQQIHVEVLLEAIGYAFSLS
jgi:hypothetical protein